jgi:hypothetical protein
VTGVAGYWFPATLLWVDPGRAQLFNPHNGAHLTL